jgi:16S rRNA (uracil1498-N3)-methyltransferase
MAGHAGLPVRTTGPHFFVPPSAVEGDRAVLDGDDARHLTAVLRGRPGDAVSVADGTGAMWQARIGEVSGADAVTLVLVDRFEVPAPTPRITVVHGLPKGRKLDEVVQRLTEVGVDRLVPVHTSRSPVQLEGTRAGKAVARWRAVAHAAAKQSRRARLLEIAAVGYWPAELAGSAVAGAGVAGVDEARAGVAGADEARAGVAGADEARADVPKGPIGAVLWEEAEQPLRAVMAGWPVDLDAGFDGTVAEIVLGIGPEGGLTAAEVRATGLPAALLGPTILRTETAALVAASVVLHRLGRLG